jgi:hypothetical protein
MKNIFTIAEGSLKITYNDEVTHLIAKKDLSIISNELYKIVPRAVIFNLNGGYNEKVFDVPLSTCSEDGITPFTVESFIIFAENYLGFYDDGGGGGGTSGTSGVNGTSGTSGTGGSGSGTSGTSGTSGNGTSGTSGVNGTSGTSPTLTNNQKTITYPADFTGTNYTLQNGDNTFTIFINNGATAVTITIPAGLTANHEAYYLQQGSGDVSYGFSGTTIHSPDGKIKIAKQYGWASTIKVQATEVFQLAGLLKT